MDEFGLIALFLAGLRVQGCVTCNYSELGIPVSQHNHDNV